jgi:DNA polymerase III subunit delta
MIVKAFEFNKVDLKKNQFYLFYGENNGHKNEIIKNKIEKQYSNNIFRYDEKEVLDNRDNFFNSIFSKSLFESEKLIIISRASDKINIIIEEILEKKTEDVKFILISDILDKKSKLRNLFEKHKQLICTPFYADTNQTLNIIAFNFFKEHKIPISREITNLLVERCRGDRQNLNNELSKIKSYCLNKKKVDVETILKITNLAEDYNVSELTDSCLVKDLKKTITIINENNLSTEDSVLIIRTFLSKVKRLIKLQEQIQKINIDSAIASFKPPIFWKDKDIIKKQIFYWPLKSLKKLIIEANEIELLIKKNSINSINILSDFIVSKSKRINN